MLIELFLPLYVASVAILLLVLRAGASRVFFDVVGTFQAERLIADAKAKVGVFEGLLLDGLTGITESAALLDEQLQAVVDTTVPLARNIAEAKIEFEKFANFAEAATVEADIIAFGESIGFTADQALNAGSRMAQLSGVLGGGATVGTATEMGITFGLIGGMETQEAMTRLINLQQQTGFMQGELTRGQFNMMSAEQQANIVRANSISLLDSLNTVENRSSATMQQITFVMNQFASSAQLAGDSIHFMAGASATLIEAGEEQGKAGRALRMMYARLGANTGENAEILAKHNIAVKDSNGQLRAMEDILGDIAKSRIMDSDAEKMRVAQAIAGNDHYVRAIKLMEGYDRAMQLTTESSQGLDSATEELNRRLGDEAVQLQLAETRLDNMRAKLGDALIPAVTRATRGQADFNAALADFVSTDFGGATASIFFTIQQYARTFAPFGEALLNIMSLNVALRTQETIMRGLGGVEIARASAYGMKNQQEATSLANLRQELNLQDQITFKKIQEIQMQKMKLASLQQIQMAMQLSQFTTIASLEAEEQQIMERYNKEIALLKEVSILNKLHTSDEFRRLQLAQEGLVKLDGRLTKEAQLREIARQTNGYRMEGVAVQEKETRLMNNKLFLRNSDKQAQLNLNSLLVQEENHKRTLLSLGHLDNILNERGVHINRQKDGSYQLEIMNQEKVMQGHVNAVNAIRQKKVELLQYTLQVLQTGRITGQANTMEIMILNAASAATERLSQSNMKKANVQQVSNVISEESSRVAMKLAAMLGIESDVLQRLIAQLPIFSRHVNAAKAAEDAMAATSMRNSQALMMLNANLGIASMGLSVFAQFTDDAEMAADLMQASMVAMGISMVVSTASMGKMGAQMVVTAGQTMGQKAAQDSLNVSMNAGTVAANKLKFALKSIGIGFALVLGSYLISKIIPNTNKAGESIDDLAMSFDQLKGSATFTAKELEDYNRSIENMDLLGIADRQKQVQEEIVDLEKQYRSATNETTRDILGEKVKALAQEEQILRNIVALRGAENIATGKFSEEFLADQLNAAKQFRTVTDDYEDVMGTEFIPGFLGIDAPDFLQDILTERDEERARVTEELANLPFLDPRFKEGTLFFDLALQAENTADFIRLIEEAGMSVEDIIAGFDGVGPAIEESFIRPIEAARQTIEDFGSEREELFFGMKAGNITGDMLKQVVNKGVETLINTTELIMNNTFNGMTTRGAANEIIRLVEDSLAEKGVNLAE